MFQCVCINFIKINLEENLEIDIEFILETIVCLFGKKLAS